MHVKATLFDCQLLLLAHPSTASVPLPCITDGWCNHKLTVLVQISLPLMPMKHAP